MCIKCKASRPFRVNRVGSPTSHHFWLSHNCGHPAGIPTSDKGQTREDRSHNTSRPSEGPGLAHHGLGDGCMLRNTEPRNHPIPNVREEAFQRLEQLRKIDWMFDIWLNPLLEAPHDLMMTILLGLSVQRKRKKNQAFLSSGANLIGGFNIGAYNHDMTGQRNMSAARPKPLYPNWSLGRSFDRSPQFDDESRQTSVIRRDDRELLCVTERCLSIPSHAAE